MNRLCKELSIRYPVIHGGMGNISSVNLAAAISEAGGLGTIGCGTSGLDEVEQKITDLKSMTSRPFAVNIAINVAPQVEELLALVIKHRVPIVSLSAGNPSPYIQTLHDNEIKVMAIVASVKHALKAEAAGADIIVAEGFEAAGINSPLELTTMTLIPQITKSIQIPVVAAGGIGDGKGLAAALALGAEGVQMGTRFIATQEMQAHELYKQRLLDASDIETRIIGREVGRVRRVLTNDYVMNLEKRVKEGMKLEEFNEATTEVQHVLGAIKGDMQNGYINSGQVAGLIGDIPTVQELLERMMIEAKEACKRTANLL
ncbi:MULTISPECIES: nitronate monooxygenase family protein [unclassified Sporosarcina]|uniref:NAD(P)H-dependent flavin oxidoreductase n=1 Tax=unclassified Sporosarcina TaxID=2647733 RepID=UPI000C171571|nr:MULTISPECIES: nitronate monooxygenase [unclassified Sporosarcina]PID01725.1 2-nitropropane dioxygenase [Sporosarcina sp. P2]PID25307.1 2-nitropropane dioxygenase [Sporosarcina sp. P7]